MLPFAAVLALVLASQGVIQNFDGYKDATTVEKLTYQNPKTDAAGNPIKDAAGNPVTETATTQTQTLPMGPIASQEAIKELGTNGGGFFNANSAHPYENPTPLTNLLEMFAIFLIPFALTYTFGKMVGDTRQGWVVLAAMLILFVPLVITAFHSEQNGNPLIAKQGVDQVASPLQAGGNMEGKETRFGIAASALFAAATTATSCGAVNTHARLDDALGRLRADVPHPARRGRAGRGRHRHLFDSDVRHSRRLHRRTDDRPDAGIPRQEDRGLGDEVGLGLHPDDPVRRADRNRGRRDDGRRQGRRRESRSSRLQRDSLCVLLRPPTTTAARSPDISANTVFYNVATGLAMFIGRFWPIVAALAIAGSLAAKKRVPVTEGTMPTHGPLFVALLIGSILLIGVLTYVPALALGPVVEHFMLATAPSNEFHMTRQQLSLFDRKLIGPALIESVKKLDPRVQWRNPVMFVVYIGTIVTAILYGQALAGHGEAPAGFILAITIWLLFTVLFANFAEALAEGRSRAQASALRNMRQTVMAKRIVQNTPGARKTTLVKAEDLRKGDMVLVETHDTIPADGEVIEGVASVDESAITGESAPVIRESGGDFSSVTGGTRVLSDWIVVRVSVNPGETFLDRMISMVEAAKRQKTPNEIALTILLVALTLVFLVVIVTLLPFSLFAVEVSKVGNAGHADRARGAVGLPHPDDDRRPVVGDRRRRHEPYDAGERHRDFRPRRRGRRRRRCAAARQDRHHYTRQSAGCGVLTGARA